MPDPQTLPRFLVRTPCRPGGSVVLGPEESRHMVAVLRIGAGRQVRLFDGKGGEFLARVEVADAAGARLRVDAEFSEPARWAVPIVVAFAPPPGARADVLLEKGTELGAAAFQPVLCERLQGHQAATAARRAERWRRKAEQAARQAQRATMPEVRPPMPFPDFVRQPGRGLRLVGCPEAETSFYALLAGRERPADGVTVAVGPAGGFTRAELALAREAGFHAVSLGPHVLRVETAALCMLAGVALWLDAAEEL